MDKEFLKELEMYVNVVGRLNNAIKDNDVAYFMGWFTLKYNEYYGPSISFINYTLYNDESRIDKHTEDDIFNECLKNLGELQKNLTLLVIFND